MAKKDFKRIASEIYELVGKSQNISIVTHCVTRLRLTIKDKSLIDTNKIDAIDGVLGSKWNGEQYQIIIGNDINNVYNEFIKLGNFELNAPVEEDLDKQDKKTSFKSIFNSIINYISAAVYGIIPIITAAGLAMTLNVLLGPTLLNLYSDTSNIYIFINFLYEGCFYFLPVLLGYSAARILKLDPSYGVYMGCILITPSLINVVTAGEPFSLFGLNMLLVNYSQTMLPVLFSVWFLSVVHKFLSKHIPNVVSSVLVPLCTMLISTPVALFLLAPIGTFLSTYIAAGISWFSNTFGFLSVATIAGLWILFVILGVHGAVFFAYLPAFFEKGVEYNVMPAAWAYTCAIWGIAIAGIISLRHKKDGTAAIGYLTSALLGGVSEPTIFGLIMKYKKLLACQIIGAFCGGLFLGITKTAVYAMTGSSNFTSVLAFAAGGTANITFASIGGIISVIVTATLGVVWGLKDVE